MERRKRRETWKENGVRGDRWKEKMKREREKREMEGKTTEREGEKERDFESEP